MRRAKGQNRLKRTYILSTQSLPDSLSLFFIHIQHSLEKKSSNFANGQYKRHISYFFFLSCTLPRHAMRWKLMCYFSINDNGLWLECRKCTQQGSRGALFFGLSFKNLPQYLQPPPMPFGFFLKWINFMLMYWSHQSSYLQEGWLCFDSINPTSIFHSGSSNRNLDDPFELPALSFLHKKVFSMFDF